MISIGDISTYFPSSVLHWLLQGNSEKQDSATQKITKERGRNKL